MTAISEEGITKEEWWYPLFHLSLKQENMNRRKQGDVSWYLPNKRRPFAYSTIAESDTIAILLEEFGDLRAVISANRILSQQERSIIQTFIDNGVYIPVIRQK